MAEPEAKTVEDVRPPAETAAPAEVPEPIVATDTKPPAEPVATAAPAPPASNPAQQEPARKSDPKRRNSSLASLSQELSEPSDPNHEKKKTASSLSGAVVGLIVVGVLVSLVLIGLAYLALNETIGDEGDTTQQSSSGNAEDAVESTAPEPTSTIDEDLNEALSDVDSLTNEIDAIEDVNTDQLSDSELGIE
jgi:hypothetical protein